MKKLILLLLFTVLLSVSLMESVFALSPVTPVDDYPTCIWSKKYQSNINLHDSTPDSLTDPWNFYSRECTSFVAWRLNERNKIPFTNQYCNEYAWGNAKYWISIAENHKSEGIVVNKTPAVGALMCTTNGRYGHVAWVSDVYKDNAESNEIFVTVEEYNSQSAYNGYKSFVYGCQTKKLSEWLDSGYQFIHMQNLPFSKLIENTDRIVDVTYLLADCDVKIKSIETNQYVCGELGETVHADGECGAGTYRTHYTSDGWIGFQLIDNSGIGSKWLSVREETGNGYLRLVGDNLEAWECFRVYEYKGNLFLLAQKDNRFVQVTDQYARPLKTEREYSLGLDGATWERFDFEFCNGTAACRVDGQTIGSGGNAPSYTISYNANGGSGAPGSQTKAYGKSLTLSNTVPTRTGFDFLGWATSSNATSAIYSAGGTYSNNASVTLYAVWKANNYTITYNANGGSGAPNSQNVQGNYCTLSKGTPTREGYIFLGWSTGSTASGAQYLSGDIFQLDSNTTLYAVWQSEALKLSTPSSWAEKYVVDAYNMKLIPDYMMEDYSLNATRVDFARLAYNAIENKCGWIQQVLYDKGLVENMEYGPPVVFTDVSENLGFNNSDRYCVAALRELGIIKGVSGNEFAPNRAITRQEAAVLLSRVHSFIRWGKVKSYSYGKTENNYTDNHLIQEWAFYDVYNMRAIDVMNGVGNNAFSPQGAYTIEQSIVTFVRLLNISNRE